MTIHAYPVRFARHSGMEQGYAVHPLASDALADYAGRQTKRVRQILGHMLAAQEQHGRLVMVSRATLRSSGQMMQELFYSGLVNGCGSADHRGTGNTPDTSWWWLTERGEQIARACGLPPKDAPR
jgi:hypothetical protein